MATHQPGSTKELSTFSLDGADYLIDALLGVVEIDQMAETETAEVKYVFLDVVNYSLGRSVEAQAEIIRTLNAIVKGTSEELKLSQGGRIYLPTGDGICIALIPLLQPYDIHIQFALRLLQRLEEHNSQTTDEARKFKIRIGINANVDNIVEDVNENRNVAGAGINHAQRVMSTCDGNQIVVSDSVYDTLRHREKYMNSFKAFRATGKHGVIFQVHQLIDKNKGLDNTIPSQFAVTEKEEVRLTKHAAYYIAHAIKNVDSLRRIAARFGAWSYAAVVLLASLAEDSVNLSESTEISPYSKHTWGADDKNFDEQLDYYHTIDYWVVVRLCGSVEEKLSGFYKCFDRSNFSMTNHFVTEFGREKLRKEWPNIWREFDFDPKTGSR